MSSSCCFQHSPIIDASTATIVCENCARVLEEGLTHFEVNPQKYYIPGENLKEEKKLMEKTRLNYLRKYLLNYIYINLVLT
jgi:hypothetical protein